MRYATACGVVLALLIGDARPAAASGYPAADLAAMLTGPFIGSTPGNDLRLELRAVTTDPQHPYDLSLDCTGKYEGANVRRQGLLRLENQGGHVYLGYIPHFDPTASNRFAPQATRFTESEANAACGISMAPRGDGFAGETSGATCVVALRASGKWTIEVEPGSIRLREVKTGETLRFRRVGK